MNGLKRLCLKRVMIIYVNSSLLGVAVYTFLDTSEYEWLYDVFWWYKKATLGRNGLKKTTFRNTDERLCQEKRLCSNRLMKRCYHRTSTNL